MVQYRAIAALMAQNPETVIFRRFQRLRARLSLLLQADLYSLEQELEDIIRRGVEPSPSDKPSAAWTCEDLDTEWETIRDSQTSLAKEHRDKIEVIHKKLGMYDDNLSRWAATQKFSCPSQTNFRWIQDWILLQNPENPLDVRPWLEARPADLLSLSPKLDSFDSWLANRFIPFWQRIIGRGSTSSCGHEENKDLEAQAAEFIRYAPKSLVFVGDTCTVLLSSAIIICSVISLNFTKTSHLRLVLISVFTVIFSSILMFAARCRRSEVFAGTAAFCAVLIVFVQGVVPIKGH